MKKNIFILFMALALVVCLAGCTRPEDNVGTKLSSDDELVIALTEYMDERFTEHDMPDASTHIKLDKIDSGVQPLHLDFKESSPYFVCAYHNGTHEQEALDYCCKDEYTWVKYENANEIRESYGDLTFIAAFQINAASTVRDIASTESSVPAVEHFKVYETAFEVSVNTNTAQEFDETYVYLNETDKETVYHSTLSYDKELCTIPCIYLDEHYYVTTLLYSEYPDGERTDADTAVDFGKYYGVLSELMITDKYSVTDGNGVCNYYGLVEIDAFPLCIYETKLNQMLEIIREDVLENEKLRRKILYKDDYYLYKKHGAHKDLHWDESTFKVNLTYSSTEEITDEWFDKYFKYDYYSLEDMIYYYDSIKALMDFEYITEVRITYFYGLPSEYFNPEFDRELH